MIMFSTGEGKALKSLKTTDKGTFENQNKQWEEFELDSTKEWRQQTNILSHRDEMNQKEDSIFTAHE